MRAAYVAAENLHPKIAFPLQAVPPIPDRAPSKDMIGGKPQCEGRLRLAWSTKERGGARKVLERLLRLLDAWAQAR